MEVFNKTISGTTEEIIHNSNKNSKNHLKFGKKSNDYIKKSEWDEYIFQKNKTYLELELGDDRKTLEADLNLSEINNIDYENNGNDNLGNVSKLINAYSIKNSIEMVYDIPIYTFGDFTKYIYIKIELFKEEDIPNLLDSEIEILIQEERIYYFPFQLILCINFLAENKIEYDINFIRIPIIIFSIFFEYGLPNINLQFSQIKLVFKNKLVGYDIHFELLYTNVSIDNKHQNPIENIIIEYNIQNILKEQKYNIHNGGILLYDILYFPNCDSDLIELRISANKWEDYISFNDFMKVKFYNYVFYIIPFCPELRNLKILKKFNKNKFDLNNINYINFSKFDGYFEIIQSEIYATYKMYSVGINKLHIENGLCNKIFIN